MSVRGDDLLERDLHRQAVVAARAERPDDPVRRCLEVARAVWVTDRAWALIRLAADLRARGDAARAIEVLDTAWELDAGDEALRAIETVAIACHCDMGTHHTAVKIEQQASALPPDLKYARAVARLYGELFDATEDEDYRIRRDAYALVISDLEGAEHSAAEVV
jgi:tetratricopeptide (TPR) repeat protein